MLWGVQSKGGWAGGGVSIGRMLCTSSLRASPAAASATNQGQHPITIPPTPSPMTEYLLLSFPWRGGAVTVFFLF